MKVIKEPPKFLPVTIVLETQEEVDKMYAILVHLAVAQIATSGEINSFNVEKCWWPQLEAYKSEDYKKFLDFLDNALVKKP